MGPWASMNENLILHSQHSQKSWVVTSASNPQEEEGRVKHAPEAHWPDSQLTGELQAHGSLSQNEGWKGGRGCSVPGSWVQVPTTTSGRQLAQPCLTPAIRNQCPFLASRGTHTHITWTHTHTYKYILTHHTNTYTHHMNTQTHTNTHTSHKHTCVHIAHTYTHAGKKGSFL